VLELLPSVDDELLPEAADDDDDEVVDRPAGRMTEGRSSLTVAPVGVLLSAADEVVDPVELPRPLAESEPSASIAAEDGLDEPPPPPLPRTEDGERPPVEAEREVEEAAMMS
jgi:hypothetical protein